MATHELSSLEPSRIEGLPIEIVTKVLLAARDEPTVEENRWTRGYKQTKNLLRLGQVNQLWRELMMEKMVGSNGQRSQQALHLSFS